jgi:hypothetical protein
VISEHESERDFLRALLQSPQFGLPDYKDDPIVRRRVGKAIAEASTNFAFNSVIRVPVANR